MPPAESSPLRIAMISAEFWPKIGGAEIQALRLAQALRKAGHRVTVYTGTMRDQQPGIIDVDGLPVHRLRLPHIPRARNLVYLLSATWTLWRKRRTYDVLHAVSALRPAFPAALLGRLLNKPVVIYVASGAPLTHDALVMKEGRYGDAFRRLDPALWRVIRRADRFQATTPEVEAGLLEAGVRPAQIARIPTGVPVPAAPARVQAATPPVILNVSRLDPLKGLEVLLRAAAMLGPAARVQIAGDGPQRAELEALHDELGLGERVALLGRRDDVPDLLQNAAIFALPSYVEGMSNALLEAMAAGLPCVVTDIGGNRALITHEETGLLIPPGDPDALAAALQRLLNTPALRLRLGRAARERIQAQFSMEANAAQFTALYRELLAEKAPSAKGRAMPATSPADRFAFGKNWQHFLNTLNETRIQTAVESLQAMLEVETLAGQRFLDIGSGSGLFSLAARRLGAQVHAFDYDPESVACTQALKARFYPDDPDWTIAQASALDEAYLQSLGKFDVVYSWGVLHHTGEMWRGLANADLPVKPGGLLFVAIYNDRGIASRTWRAIKRGYNLLPGPLRVPYVLAVQIPREAKALVTALVLGRPGRYLRTFSGYDQKRGMSRWHDIVDWIGGYPYEVARPEAIFDFYRARGYRLRKLTTNPGLGCNQFVLQKHADTPPEQ